MSECKTCGGNGEGMWDRSMLKPYPCEACNGTGEVADILSDFINYYDRECPVRDIETSEWLEKELPFLIRRAKLETLEGIEKELPRAKSFAAMRYKEKVKAIIAKAKEGL